MRGLKPATIKAGGADAISKIRVPAWLSKDARDEWRRIIPVLTERRILTAADLGSVESYCVAMGRIREIERLIQANPLDKALYRLQVQAQQVARQTASELGLTPVSRSRAAIQDAGDDPEDSDLGL